MNSYEFHTTDSFEWCLKGWLCVFVFSCFFPGGSISSGIFQGTNAITGSTPFSPTQQVSGLSKEARNLQHRAAWNRIFDQPHFWFKDGRL